MRASTVSLAEGSSLVPVPLFASLALLGLPLICFCEGDRDIDGDSGGGYTPSIGGRAEVVAREAGLAKAKWAAEALPKDGGEGGGDGPGWWPCAATAAAVTICVSK